MKKFLILILSMLCTVAFICGCSCSDNGTGGSNGDNTTNQGGNGDNGDNGDDEVEDIIQNNGRVWLDRYEERDINLGNEDATAYTWSSGDEQVVTIENYKLIAMGVGETTVVGTKGNATFNITVKVNDSGAEPYILLDDCLIYNTTQKTVTPKLYYNEKEITKPVEYTLSSRNEDKVTVDGLTLTAVSEGEATIDISTTYKGLDIFEKIYVTVKPYSFVETDKMHYDLFDVNNTRLNQVTPEINVVYQGQIVENPTFTAEITGNSVEFINGTTIKMVTTGQSHLVLKYTEDESLSVSLTVNVQHGYVDESFVNNNITSAGVYYEWTNETVGGRTGMMKYVSGNYTYDDQGWTDYWGNHKLETTQDNANMGNKYRYEGYRYFAYDLYVDGDSFNLLFGMPNMMTFFARTGQLFRSDYFMVLDEDGNITNRLEPRKWQTIVYDIYEILYDYPSIPMKFNFAMEAENVPAYIMNSRYWLSDAFITNKVEYTEQSGYVSASASELLPYRNNANVTYEAYKNDIGGKTDSYVYTTATSDPVNNGLAVYSSLGMGRSDSYLGLADNGRIFVFDIYIEQADSLAFTIDGTTKSLGVGASNLTKYSWIFVYRNGKQQYTLTKGAWLTVCIDYKRLFLDENATTIDMQIALAGEGDKVYIRDIRYYPDGKFIPTEYEGQPPIDLIARDENAAYVQEVTEGNFAGNLKIINVANTDEGKIAFKGVEVNGVPGSFYSDGSKYVNFAIYADSSVSTLNLIANVTKMNHTIGYEYTATLGAALPASTMVYFYDMTGDAVTQINANTWYYVTMRVDYGKNSESAEVSLLVKGTGEPFAYVTGVNFSETAPYAVAEIEREVAPIDDTYSTTVYQTEGEFAGATLALNYTAGETNSAITFPYVQENVWPTENGFFKNGYTYITFDFYAKSNVSYISLHSYATAANEGTHNAQNITLGMMFDHNEYFYVYDANKNPVNTINYGEWYTITMKVDAPASGATWSFICVHTFSANGAAPSEVYYKNVEYSKDLLYPYQEPVVSFYTTTSEGATIEKETTGSFAGNWKVTAPNGIYQDTGVQFVDLAADETSYGGFYKAGYSHVTFKFYVTNAQALSLYANATPGVSDRSVDWIPMSDLSALDGNYWRFYNSKMERVYAIENNQWYTVSIFINYWRDTAITDSNVSIGFQPSGSAAVGLYLETPSYGYTFPTATVTQYYSTSATGATITKEDSGEFAGKWKVEQTQTGIGTEIFQGNGIKFTDLYTDGASYGDAYKKGYTFVSVKFYVTGGQAMSMYANITPGANGIGSDWVLMSGLSSVDSNYFYFYNASGERVYSVQNGEWYTMYIYLNYWKDTAITDANVSFGFQPLDGGKVTVYLEDPAYYWEMPSNPGGSGTTNPDSGGTTDPDTGDNTPTTPDVTDTVPFTTSATGATVAKETAGDFAGKWKVEQTQTGNGTEIFQGNGIKFTDLYADNTGYGDAYKNGYSWVSVKFYVTGGQAMSMYANATPGPSGISSDWVLMSGLSSVNENYFYFYNASGERVYSVQNGEWYTLVIYLNYWKDNVITDANVSFGFQPADGGKVTVYLEDPVYSTANPMD